MNFIGKIFAAVMFVLSILILFEELHIFSFEFPVSKVLLDTATGFLPKETPLIMSVTLFVGVLYALH